MERMKGNAEFKDTVWHGWHHSQCGSQAQGKLVEIVLPEFHSLRSENAFQLQQPERQSHQLMYLMISCEDGSGCIWNVASGGNLCLDVLWRNTQQASNVTIVIMALICTVHNCLLCCSSVSEMFWFVRKVFLCQIFLNRSNVMITYSITQTLRNM